MVLAPDIINDDEEAAAASGPGFKITAPVARGVRDAYAGSMMEAIIEETSLL